MKLEHLLPLGGTFAGFLHDVPEEEIARLTESGAATGLALKIDPGLGKYLTAQVKCEEGQITIFSPREK